MTATHLCLGVGPCRCGDDRALVKVELTYTDIGDAGEIETIVKKVETIVDDTPGLRRDRPVIAQPGFVDGDVFVTAVLRVTDYGRLPEESRPDPEDGPSVTGGILESIMEHADAIAGGAHWCPE